MEPVYIMKEEQWDLLLQDVAESFDEVTLSRGFQYYKQDRVLSLSETSPRELEAIVEGNETYTVTVNLDFFTLSRCSCPVEGFCKHMAAALLQYANIQGRSVHLLANANALAAPKNSRRPPAPYANSYTKLLRETKEQADNAEKRAKLMEQMNRIPTMSIPEWHDWFELCTSPQEGLTRNTSYVREALNAIYSSVTVHIDEETERFFKLHAQLFILSKLTKQLPGHSDYYHSYIGYHTHLAISEIQDKIQLFFTVDETSAPAPRDGPHLGQTLTYLRQKMLSEPQGQFFFSTHYENFWKFWVHPGTEDAQVYTDELQNLEQDATTISPAFSRTPFLLAKCLMQYYLSQDQEAWKLLQEAQQSKSIPIEYVLYFFAEISLEEQWDRLVSWLQQAGPWFHSQRSDNLHAYSQYWDLAVSHLPESESLMLETLVSMLPYALAIYEDKLIERGKWQLWADFHLSSGTEPLDFRVSELAPLEKNAPEMLLPFYHQAVERYVLSKNRVSYRAAVKLLKRLNKLYRKMKQEQRWELFFHNFCSRHSRLRALNEELRKGKLMP